MSEQVNPHSVEQPAVEAASAHDAHDHIVAVFADRAAAEAAVDDLRALGLGSEHLGVAVRSTEQVVFEHDMDTETLRDVGAKAAVGAPLGFLAGIALVSLAAPGIGVGGLLALASVGAGWGAFLGSYIGIGTSDRASTAHEDIEATRLQPGEVLVVACSHGRGDEVRGAFQRHDGRIREVPRVS